MAKKSPKRQPQPATDSTTDPTLAKVKAAPISVKKQQPLTAEELKARQDFLRTSREVERQWWRIIY
jgi:hypothetical protein